MALTNSIEEFLIKDAKLKRYPLNAKIELLPMCNLNCKMCYIRSTPEMVRKNGGLKNVDQWLEIGRQLKELNTLNILLTGGEVFLYPDFQRLYEELYDMGFMITINTNATLIDEKVVNYLEERPPKCVSISLYGASDETYEVICGAKGMFHRVDHAIAMLLEKNIRVECKTMLTPLNKQDLEACWKYVEERHIPYETATYSYPPNRKLEQQDQIRLNPYEAASCRIDENMFRFSLEENIDGAKSLIEKYENTPTVYGQQKCGFSCAGSVYTCWITWQGKMTPCAMLEQPYTEPFVEGVSAAWERLKLLSDQVRMCTDCVNCDKRNICHTCPAANYAETGSFEKPAQFHCDYTDHLLSLLYTIVEKEGIGDETT